MPVHRGTTKTVGIYRGTTEILQRYRGIQLVYSTAQVDPGVVQNWVITTLQSQSGSTVYSGAISSNSGTASSNANAQAAIDNFLDTAPASPPSPWQNVVTESDISPRQTSGGRVYSGIINSAGGTRNSRSSAEAAISAWQALQTASIPSPYTNRDFTDSIVARFISGGSRVFSATINSGSGTENTQGAAQAAANAILAGASPSSPYTNTDSTSSVVPRVISGGNRVYSGYTNGSGTENSQSAASDAAFDFRFDAPSPSAPYTNITSTQSVTARTIPGTPGRTVSGPNVVSGSGSSPSQDQAHRDLQAYDASVASIVAAAQSNIPHPYTYIAAQASVFHDQGWRWFLVYRYYYNVPATPATTVYDWSASYRYYYDESSETVYDWSASYRYYYDPAGHYVYDWSASYRYYYTSSGGTVYDWTASYQYSRILTAVITTYQAEWARPLVGSFTQYRIERTTLGGSVLSSIILPSTTLLYIIGTTRRRVRIRAERPADEVVGPWSAWIS